MDCLEGKGADVAARRAALLAHRTLNAIRVAAGLEPTTLAGPDYWLLPNRVSMYEQSKLIELQLATGNGSSQTATDAETPPHSA